MKLTNYNYGYIPAFSCSIHGKITMTPKEWRTARTFLFRGKRRWLPCYPWISPRILEDEKRSVKSRTGYRINIRVPATEAIAKRFKLNGYKKQNYMIEVVTHSARA